ncbi:MAG: DUF86 domain-containing protein [Phormidesmis sp. CAN_BIN44]|nr:DUF86 domain-containing protein [Phormidesmis sp. CAN_BIN44]
MREAAREALFFAQKCTRDDLGNNRMLTLSVVKCIEIIGEAASWITKDGQNKPSNIPWAQVISIRNRLTHAYFEINLDIVWSTVTEDLPILLAELETIVDNDTRK